MKRKVSLSIGELQVKFGDDKALIMARDVGCDAVDFDTSYCDYRDKNNIFSKSEEEIIAHYTYLKHLADSLGLEIAHTHGRIQGFRNIPEEDDAFIKNARLDCMAAKVLGTKHVVMHSVTTIYLGPDADPQFMRDLNFDMFNRCLEFAREFDVKIATETFGDAFNYGCCDFFGNYDEFVNSYERVRNYGDNAKNFCICVDTGHSNKATRFGNPPSAEVLRRLGKHVEVLHLNDNDTYTDQHKMPCTGTLDWNDILSALDEIDYKGYYNMELTLGSHFGNGFEYEECEFAVKVMRHLLKERYGEI